MCTIIDYDFNYIYERLDAMCQDILAGDKIIREERPKTISWAWVNIQNKKEYTITLPIARRILNIVNSDPKAKIIIKFIKGIKTPLEAKYEIERLNKLSAFW